MLDLDARIVVATAPDAAVYGDDRDPSRFYAFASRPRVATDAAGRPLLSVLVYRRGKDNPPEGGQVSLTTTLALSAEERAAILQSLPPDRGPGPLGAPVPERRSEVAVAPLTSPTIVAPEWLSGEVTVRLAEGLELTGQPSLAGDNTCVLLAALDAAGAAVVARAVGEGLVDATATYSVEVAVGRSSGAHAETRSEGGGRVLAYDVQVDVSSTERHRFELAGPLGLERERVDDLMTVIGF